MINNKRGSYRKKLPNSDIEIFKFNALKKAYFSAKKDHEREHVTPYIWDNLNKFKVENYSNLPNDKLYKKYRLTLDYKEDFYVIWSVYKSLYPKKKYFELKDIINLLKQNKKIIMNNHLIKVNWYRHVYKSLKTIGKKDTNSKT